MSEKSEHTTYNQLTLFAADSLAKTSAMLENRGVSCQLREAASGSSLPESFARLGQDGLSWRTYQRCLTWEWGLFCETWPRAGMMQNGKCYQQQPLVPRISGTGASLLPTPRATARGCSFNRVEAGVHRHNLEDYVAIAEGHTRDGGTMNLHPEWCEWLMGFPISWTDLEHSEMQLSPK